jgi:hypothetical protein
MLIGTLAMLPIILGYTLFVYWILGGTLSEGEGYHEVGCDQRRITAPIAASSDYSKQMPSSKPWSLR